MHKLSTSIRTVTVCSHSTCSMHCDICAPMQGRFQLLVSTEDADSDADDLIDRNAFNQQLLPTGTWTEVFRVHGYYKAAHVAMQFKASCDQYYYTQSCTVYCKAQDDNVEGHYNCNSEGGKVCLTGWSDPSNNCLTRERMHTVTVRMEVDNLCMINYISVHSNLCRGL